MKKHHKFFLPFASFLVGTLLLSALLYSSKQTKQKNDLFDDTVIHEIKINFQKKSNYWDTLVYHKKIRDSLEQTDYLKANITVDGSSLHNIGIRIKGESSYTHYPSKKKSFKISFNRFVKNQRYQGLRKINLNNSLKDPTMMRGKLYLELLKKLKLPYQRSAYAKVYLNDEYWGLYLIAEQIDEKFIKRNFKDKKGVLFKSKSNKPDLAYRGDDMNNYLSRYSIKVNKKEKKWSYFMNFLKSLNTFDTDPKTYIDNLSRHFNIEHFLKNCALNNIIVNIDAYNMYYMHNYYLYYHKKKGQFEWINYDGNYSFGAWSPKFNLSELEKFDLFYVRNNNPLMAKLFKNPYIRSRYLSIIQHELMSVFNEDFLFKRIDELKKLIEKPVYADTLKMYNNEEFKSNTERALGDVKDPGAFTPGLKSFIKNRRKHVLKQLNKHLKTKSINKN